MRNGEKRTLKGREDRGGQAKGRDTGRKWGISKGKDDGEGDGEPKESKGEWGET